MLKAFKGVGLRVKVYCQGLGDGGRILVARGFNSSDTGM